MVINLENVFNCGITELPLSFDFDFSGIDINGVFPFTAPVHLSGKITNETDIVYIHAKAELLFSGVCDRCAEPFSRKMTFPVEHILVSELNDEDNDEFILAEGMQLDIFQLTMEDILLSLPMIVLCKEDCKGMCSRCGKNLNKGACDCKKDMDPRWADLMQLLNE